MTQYCKKTHLYIPGIAMFASALMVASIDIYLPAAPYLCTFFNASAYTLQLSFGISPLVSAIVGIMYGWWSDRSGRKRPFFLSGFLFTLGSFLCAISKTLTLFLIGRTLQAIGSGGMSVLALSVLGDLFKGVQYARYLAIYSMLFPVTFALAPVLGAWLFEFFGWQSNFWILMGGGGILMCLTQIFLSHCPPASLPILNTNDHHLLSRLKILFKIKEFWRYGFAHTLPVVMGTIISTNSAFLIINYFGKNPLYYANLNFFWALFNLIGCLFYFYYVKSQGIFQSLRLGMRIELIFGCLILFGCVCGFFGYIPSLLFLTLTIIVLQFSLSSTISSSATRCFESAPPPCRGLAVSIINLLRNGLVSCGIALSGFLFDGTIFPVYWVCIVLIGLHILLLWPYLRHAE